MGWSVSSGDKECACDAEMCCQLYANSSTEILSGKFILLNLQDIFVSKTCVKQSLSATVGGVEVAM
jgi:hypothetical protein